jgi:DNA-directed RNA polymerase specialized sigma24 family protein
MDRDAALASLPEIYARALRLREDGHDDAEIARDLRVDAPSLRTLLEVAERKLTNAMNRVDGARQENSVPPRRHL